MLLRLFGCYCEKCILMASTAIWAGGGKGGGGAWETKKGSPQLFMALCDISGQETPIIMRCLCEGGAAKLRN